MGQAVLLSKTTDGSVRMKLIGVAISLVGISWVGWLLLYPFTLYYGYVGGYEARLLWDVFVLPQVGWWLAALASALLVPLGYSLVRGRSPRRIALAAVGLYCLGGAVLSYYRPLFLVTEPRPNSYLLTGAVLVVGALIFLERRDRGYWMAGCIAGALGVGFFYFGGYVLPPAFLECLGYLVSYPSLVYVRPPFMEPMTDTIEAWSALLSLAAVLALLSLSLRGPLSAGRRSFQRLAGLAVGLAVLIAGVALVVLGLMAANLLEPFLASVLSRTDLVVGAGAVPTTTGLLLGGVLFSSIQFVGGIILAGAGAIDLRRGLSKETGIG
jgi:hypothetical protein